MPGMVCSPELLQRIEAFVCEDAVGASALRGQAKGTRKVVVGFLKTLDLSRIPHADQDSFNRWLDAQTDILRNRLPDPTKPWGVARKALNLFLRSSVYNYFLRKAYGLDAVEPLLEVPLDSVVGKSLREQAGDGNLPPWGTLKSLTPEVSALFQRQATRLAAEHQLPARVFLDNYLWLDGH